MTDDEDDRPLLLCNRCRQPVYIEKSADNNPHQCGCSDDPAGWRIATQDEVLNRAGEW